VRFEIFFTIGLARPARLKEASLGAKRADHAQRLAEAEVLATAPVLVLVARKHVPPPLDERSGWMKPHGRHCSAFVDRRPAIEGTRPTAVDFRATKGTTLTGDDLDEVVGRDHRGPRAGGRRDGVDDIVEGLVLCDTVLLADAPLTFREFVTHEEVPLATIFREVLEFLGGRADAILFGPTL
jgi:hypothetical protein